MGLGLPSCFGHHWIVCDTGDLGSVLSCLCGICAEHLVASWLLALFLCLWEVEKGTQAAKHGSEQELRRVRDVSASFKRRNCLQRQVHRMVMAAGRRSPHRQSLGAGNPVWEQLVPQK